MKEHEEGYDMPLSARYLFTSSSGLADATQALADRPRKGAAAGGAPRAPQPLGALGWGLPAVARRHGARALTAWRRAVCDASSRRRIRRRRAAPVRAG